MTTPDPIPNALVKPGNADDPKYVHRLEACATKGKQDAAGAPVENLCHHYFIVVSPTLD
jgi:hypothetical protein